MIFFILAYGTAADKRQGIFSLRFNEQTGSIEHLNFYPMSTKPGSFVKKGATLIVSSIDTNNKESYLTTFTLDANSSLVEERIIKQEYFYSFLSLSKDARYLLGASFYEGVDSIFDLKNIENPLSTYHHKFRKRTDKAIQLSCHSHYIAMTPDGKYVYSTDLGTDEVLVYNFYKGEITLNKEKMLDRSLGSGPRLMPFNETNNQAYLLNELSNDITVFSYSDGMFKKVQNISTLKKNYTRESTAAGIEISPVGNLLAVSNRGEDSIAIYDIDPVKGLLSLKDKVYTGKKPRDIVFAGNNFILVCSEGDNRIQVIEIKNKAYLFKEFLTIPNPVFIKKV